MISKTSPPTPSFLLRLWRAGEISAMTGLSLPRVYQLAREGILPCVKVGRSIRFSQPAVEAWIEAGGAASGNGSGPDSH